MWPRTWQLTNVDGSTLCTVSTGWSVAAVTTACGLPSTTGTRPKVLNGLTTFCSAPCERRGRSLVFYDCEGKVARVEMLTTEWQGCLGLN